MSRSTALAVFALAFALRLGHVMREGPPPAPVADAAEYSDYADSLLDHGRFASREGNRATRMPGYPVFVAAVRAVAGPSGFLLQAAQAAVGALTCVFIGWWAAALVPAPWPLACALAAAAYSDLIAPSSWLLGETLFSCLLAASFLALQGGPSGAARASAAGLLFGLTGLVRPEVLPAGGLLCAGLPWLGGRRRDAALAAAFFVVPVGLWAARNAAVLGRFVPTTSTAAFNLYAGLHIPLERLGLESSPRHAPPEGLGEMARDAEYVAAFRELSARTPLLSRLKAHVFNGATVFYPFLPGYDWTYMALVPLWVAGIAAAARRPELAPAAGMVVWLTTVYALLAGPVSRYRFGFAPCLLVLAAGGAAALERGLGRRARVWAAFAAWTAVNAAVWFWAPQLRALALAARAALLQ